MCLQDFQLGNLIRPVFRVVPIVSANATRVATRNNQRVGILFGGTDVSNSFFLAPAEIAVSTDGLAVRPSFAGTVEFTQQRHGSFVYGEFWAISSAANSNIIVIEFILPDDTPLGDIRKAT